jgi:hypothetical protein
MQHRNVNTMAIYSEDTIVLRGPIHAELLIVHLGDPGPRVDVGEYMLTWGTLELHGEGYLRIGRSARQRNTFADQDPERSMGHPPSHIDLSNQHYTSGFSVFVSFVCPNCKEIRDNPSATTLEKRGNFRNLVNAAEPKLWTIRMRGGHDYAAEARGPDRRDDPPATERRGLEDRQGCEVCAGDVSRRRHSPASSSVPCRPHPQHAQDQGTGLVRPPLRHVRPDGIRDLHLKPAAPLHLL